MEEPQNYVYLPPDDWKPGPVMMQTDDQQPQMKKVLTRKTTKYHYHYKMTKTPKPPATPEFPVYPSHMATILKQNQHRNPSNMATILKQNQHGNLSNMADILKQNQKEQQRRLELRTDQIKLPQHLNPQDSSTFYKRAGMLMALSKMAPTYADDAEVAQDLTKPTTASATSTAWMNDGFKIKEEPTTIDVDETADNQNLGDSDAESEQSLIKKSFTLPTRGDTKGFQPSDIEDSIDDEYLMQYFLTGKAAAMNLLGKLVKWSLFTSSRSLTLTSNISARSI